MSRWRILVLIVLAAAPIVFLAGFGSYALWERGWSFTSWWPMAACWAICYFLAWRWQRGRKLLPPVDFHPPMLWTDRDRQAWQLVEARAKSAAEFDAERLTSFQFYIDTAQEMAVQLAGAYHPGANDPIAQLTLPEILAVVELVSHDLAEMVERYLPGSHLLTIRHWRAIPQAADWYRRANNIYWAVAALFSPVQTGVRYAASQLGMGRALELLQQDLLLWFYTAYVHQVGTYLIELNSGRLRIGARRYRELVKSEKPEAERDKPPAGPQPATDHSQPTTPSPPAGQVTITVMGQVKAGKSSFVNALLGEQRAVTDVLPATNEITRYELQPKGITTRLALLDTVGYGHEGPRQDQLEATERAAQESDLLVLVMHARNPARQADLELLQGLQAWFASHPERKMPPILGVLTHIDLLSPAMEWTPPYQWQQPQRPKEHQTQQAVTTVRDQLGDYLVGCVPLCTLQGKVYGVSEWLLPTMAELLDEAHAVGLLRVLQAEADAGKVRKVFQQLLAVSSGVARVLWDKYRRTEPRR
jgi:uncharacterized protein